MAYTVDKKREVTIITGKVPIEEMLLLQRNAMKSLSESAICDRLLADHLGAVAVWGEQAHCNALRKEYGLDT